MLSFAYAVEHEIVLVIGSYGSIKILLWSSKNAYKDGRCRCRFSFVIFTPP